MKIEQIQIPARDGYMLSAKLYLPEEVSKGFVQIHTGTGIPQLLYSNFASFMAECGFTALTFDYRGIGESAPKSMKGSQAKISDWGKFDMSGVFDWVLANFPNHKKIIVAHSMGGQMVGLMDNHKSIDQLFLIASSTGYWRDMSSPYKWLPAFYWYFLIPIHIRLFGYVNAMKVKQGENLPKGVALEWRKWCTNPDYFEPEFGKTLNPLFFDQITTPIKSIQIQDDPLANKITANKLLKYFKNAPIDVECINPENYGVKKIGHTGFFSRKFKDSLWTKIVVEIQES
ncbi:MAG: alpha/beta fold hydrolase [Flavobacterium sp.]|jgi:predicted alpha/beta hydrolase|uniref:alpha/beta hydrolase family protein n=1 Tax=Flavobacterium sp. TaxID=239 RepID=UPI0022C849AF|nr:alpha/beta fold hydrolase [Flavobacterium sp.]MCZ8297795.1 alpha/beta fold hydrolase [Flavobacterium sp.]